MPYIGKIPAIGNYQVLDALTATTTDTYALTKNSVAVYPQTPANCIVSLNGVIQAPFSSYNISGSNIVFASALTGSDSIDFITVLGDVLNVGTVSDGTIGLAKLSATGTKDATTFLRGDNTFAEAGGTNTPAFYVAQSSAQSIPNTTFTKIQFNQERYDTDNAYDNLTNYRFTVPSGKAGKYFFTYACGFGGFGADKMLYIHLRINGTQQNYQFLKNSTSGDHTVNGSSILDLNAGDYVEVFVYHDHGSAISTDISTGDKYGVVYFGGYKLIT